MEKIGKRTWNKDKKDNPVVKNLPKDKDKFRFKNVDVCVDIEILKTDKHNNPLIVMTPAKDSEKEKFYKIKYDDSKHKQSLLQISEKEYKEKFT